VAHAAHFLRRLERIEPAEVELALSLYRDPPLVRELLSRAKLPDGAGRVALSLAHPVDGPFVVLERSGAFVTCLGRGMRAGDLPCVTRATLDAVAEQVRELRDRILQAREVTGKDESGAMRELCDRIWSDAYRITREEIRAATAFLPVLGPSVAGSAVEGFKTWVALEGTLASRHNIRRRDAEFEAKLERFAQLGFSIATSFQLYLVTAVESPQTFPDHPAFPRELEPMARLGARFKHPMMRARALNGIGRAGHLLAAGLETYIAERRTTRTVAELWPLYRALLACACGHPELRAEVCRFFQRGGQQEFGFAALLGVGLESTAAFGELRAKSLVEAGVQAGLLPPEARQAAGDSAVVPAVLAAAARDDERDREAVVDSLMAVPLFAAAKPEDLYLPRGALDLFREVPISVRAREVLERVKELAPGPAVAQAEPGRNDPCPCGSGRKYKKCCQSAA